MRPNPAYQLGPDKAALLNAALPAVPADSNKILNALRAPASACEATLKEPILLMQLMGSKVGRLDMMRGQGVWVNDCSAVYSPNGQCRLYFTSALTNTDHSFSQLLFKPDQPLCAELFFQRDRVRPLSCELQTREVALKRFLNQVDENWHAERAQADQKLQIVQVEYAQAGEQEKIRKAEEERIAQEQADREEQQEGARRQNARPRTWRMSKRGARRSAAVQMRRPNTMRRTDKEGYCRA